MVAFCLVSYLDVVCLSSGSLEIISPFLALSLSIEKDCQRSVCCCWQPFESPHVNQANYAVGRMRSLPGYPVTVTVRVIVVGWSGQVT